MKQKLLENLIQLMQADLNEYEMKYNGQFAENPTSVLATKRQDV